MIDRDQVLRMFSIDKSQARRLYMAYIGDGTEVKREDIYKTVSQRILGEEQFIDKVMEKIDERFENKRKHHEYSLKKIVETIEKMRGITLSKVIGKSRRREILSVRKLVSIVEREFGYKGKEIALFLQKDPSVITRYLKEGENFKMDVKRALDLLND